MLVLRVHVTKRVAWATLMQPLAEISMGQSVEGQRLQHLRSGKAPGYAPANAGKETGETPGGLKGPAEIPVEGPRSADESSMQFEPARNGALKCRIPLKEIPGPVHSSPRRGPRPRVRAAAAGRHYRQTLRHAVPPDGRRGACPACDPFRDGAALPSPLRQEQRRQGS